MKKNHFTHLNLGLPNIEWVNIRRDLQDGASQFYILSIPLILSINSGNAISCFTIYLEH